MTIQRIMIRQIGLLLAAAASLAAPAFPQQPPKAAANEAELALFNAVTQERDPAKKLALLTEWTDRFPGSTYARERNLHYLSCYSQLEGAAVAASSSAESMTLGERAATIVITHVDELFSASMLPENVSSANRAQARTEALRQAHFTVAVVASNRKDFSRAEAAYRALLAILPDDGVVELRLGTSIVSERNPERYPEAIFYLARAANQLPAGNDRDGVMQYLRTVYEKWHGDLSELDETIAAAAVAKALPAEWKIPSAAEVAKVRAELASEWEQSHPELAFWRRLKIRLAEPDAMEYFAAELKDAMLPVLKGTVTATPGGKEVVLAMEDAKPEVTLHLDSASKEKLAPGTVVAFSGVPQSFSPSPYMLVIDVKIKDLRVNP